MASAGNSQGIDPGTQEELDRFHDMMQAQVEPYVEILEQPRARGLRFRYECEGRAAGSIPGENSTPENRTYPKIQIHNSNASDAIVVVSNVTKDNPPRPHPHSLVGKDCKKGVCTVKLRKQAIATFPNLGIQCAKKKAVSQALEERKQLRVDPYQTGFDFDPTSFDLSVVRLCFQVFLPDKSGKFTRIVRPQVSQSIFDRKTVTDLVICRISRHAGSAQGGEDVFLLCDKVNKDDIEVRFFEENEEGVMWEARGDFGQPDVHRQYAIVFRTPPYRDQSIERPVTVSLQLRRPSDGEKSEPLQFTYAPIDRDPYGLQRKRIKTLHIPEYISAEPDMQAAGDSNMKTKETIKNRILAKPARRGRGPQATVVKQENSPDAAPCMMGNQQVTYQTNNVFNPNAMVNYDAGLDPSHMMNPGMQQAKPELAGANAGFEWQQIGVQEMITDGGNQVAQGQPGMGTSENGEPTAQNLLSDLAEGGHSSLTIDSGSLLQYLQDDVENSSMLLNQFLQSTDNDMQS